jgi:hypothetical protein
MTITCTISIAIVHISNIYTISTCLHKVTIYSAINFLHFKAYKYIYKSRHFWNHAKLMPRMYPMHKASHQFVLIFHEVYRAMRLVPFLADPISASPHR